MPIFAGDREADLESYVALRREALLDTPLAFAASPDDDLASSVSDLAAQLKKAPDWMIFGAFEERLIGTAGLIRDRHLKAAHKMHLWGMYVTPAARRRGVAARLLQAAIEHARAEGIEWIFLGVTAAAPEARRLGRASSARRSCSDSTDPRDDRVSPEARTSD